MKNTASFVLAILIFASLASCKKENLKLGILRLTEQGSGIPAANVEIMLAKVDTATATWSGSGYFKYYIYRPEASLGKTDSNGIMKWVLPEDFSTHGKGLIAQNSPNTWEQDISLVNFSSDYELNASVFPVAYVRVRVVHQLPGAPYATRFTVQKPNAINPNEKDDLVFGTAPPGKSVELLAKIKGNVKNSLYLEQHFDFQGNYLERRYFDVFVAARDTAFREMIFDKP